MTESNHLPMDDESATESTSSEAQNTPQQQSDVKNDVDQQFTPSPTLTSRHVDEKLNTPSIEMTPKSMHTFRPSDPGTNPPDERDKANDSFGLGILSPRLEGSPERNEGLNEDSPIIEHGSIPLQDLDNAATTTASSSSSPIKSPTYLAWFSNVTNTIMTMASDSSSAPVSPARQENSPDSTVDTSPSIINLSPSSSPNPAQSSIARPPSIRTAYSQVEKEAEKERKRDAEFHALFPDIPKEELLVNDFICALQKEVLLQGKMYITQNYVCFYANIIWVFIITIKMSDITTLTKKSIVGIFPNAIEIATGKSKHFFASFLARDAAFDLIHRLWMSDNRSMARLDSRESIPSQKQPKSELSHRSERDNEGCFACQKPKVLYLLHSCADKRPPAFSRSPFPANDKDDASSLFNPASTARTIAGKHHRSKSWDESLDANHMYFSEAALPVTRENEANILAPHVGKSQSISSPRSKTKHRSRTSPNYVTRPLSRVEEINKALGLLDNSLGSIERVTGLADIAQDEKDKKARLAATTSSKKSAPDKNSLVVQQPLPVEKIAPSVTLMMVKEKSQVIPMFTVIPCSCASLHDKMLSIHDSDFPMNIDDLCAVLFSVESANSGALNIFLSGLQYRDVKSTAWNNSSNSEEPVNGENMDHLRPGHERKVEYIVPVNVPLGPKQSSCILSESIVSVNPNYSFCLHQKGSTPDVPSGNCFQYLVRICLTARGPNLVNLKVSATIEFIKSTWIRMALESAVPEGLRNYYKQLRVFLLKYAEEVASKAMALDSVSMPSESKESSTHSLTTPSTQPTESSVTATNGITSACHSRKSSFFTFASSLSAPRSTSSTVVAYSIYSPEFRAALKVVVYSLYHNSIISLVLVLLSFAVLYYVMSRHQEFLLQRMEAVCTSAAERATQMVLQRVMKDP